ncbi:hypothetical protein F2Q70_00043770 [Brassica cretica]|uniref:Uncharacterized protein n=1 Tax=Brassica cretica TaxID=69181 RepID=A0A8S9KEJ0_BRACR|nr:hypothetical protein F2Q70_00043770 [Brassica cretica]
MRSFFEGKKTSIAKNLKRASSSCSQIRSAFKQRGNCRSHRAHLQRQDGCSYKLQPMDGDTIVCKNEWATCYLVDCVRSQHVTSVLSFTQMERQAAC